MGGAIFGAVASNVVGGLMNRKTNKAAANASDASANLANIQAEIAQDQWDRYKKNYEPLELSMIDEASKAGSDTDYAQAAGDASATVSSQFGKTRERLSRTPGFDPSSPAAMASMADLDLSQAATDATQQNVARKGVKDTAWAKKAGVMGMGKGLDSTAASSLGAASRTQAGIADMNMDQSGRNADALGRVTDRIVSAPSTQAWLGNVGSKIANTVAPVVGSGGAGSMSWGGSVQGNPDYIYDL